MLSNTPALEEEGYEQIKKQNDSESHLLKHAKRELQFLLEEVDKNASDGGPNKWVYNNVIELINVLASQGHSGMSAPYILNLFNAIAKYEIIGELTGKDDEWRDVSAESGYTLFQNIRDSRVFKDNEKAWFLDGVIFEDPVYPGSFISNENSVVFIKSFPYKPNTIYKKAPLWKKLAAKVFPKYF